MAYHIPTAEEFIDYWCARCDRLDEPVWIVPKKYFCAVSRLMDDDGVYLLQYLSRTILGVPYKLTDKIYPIQLVDRDASINYR